MAFFDAMSYNGSEGGAVYALGHSEFVRRPENKQFLHTNEEMKWWRENEQEPILDKISNADF